MRWLYSITDLMDMSLSKLRALVMDREACSATVHWVPKSWTRLSDWTELNDNCYEAIKKKKKKKTITGTKDLGFILGRGVKVVL